MGQRARILTQIAGFTGWKVTDAYWEDAAGSRFEQVGCYDVPRDSTLVLVMGRRWAPRCGQCFAVVPGPPHQRREPRRWADLPWAERRVVIEYGPERLKCRRCGSHATELLGWADAKQRQTRRLQHHLALDAFSMPLVHVSTKYGLSWHTVRRAEYAAIERWESTRPIVPLLLVGVDEKWLGRRHKNPHKYVTIVSNLETGEPVWIGYGRSAETLKSWFATLTPEQKSAIRLFAMDMHRPFLNAVREDPVLRRIPVVHDPFHIMKRAGEALTELRREVFFRAGPELRAIGRGTRWLVLRAWEKSTEEQRVRLQAILALNPEAGARLPGGRRTARDAPCPRCRDDDGRAASGPTTHAALGQRAHAEVARLDHRALRADRGARRAPPSHRTHRGAQQQLGDPCPSWPGLPGPSVPPEEAPLRRRQSRTQRRRHKALPRPRPTQSCPDGCMTRSRRPARALHLRRVAIDLKLQGS